ncbi:Hypothetical predicted protein, partial [Mytilus galloprovincialis]
MPLGGSNKNRLVIIVVRIALCLRRGAYLANLETLEEAMLLKYEIQQMKTGINFNVEGRNINRYIPGGDWRWIQNGKMIKMKYKAFGKNQTDGSNAACCFMQEKDISSTIHSVTILHGKVVMF